MSVPTTLHFKKKCRHEDLAKLRNNIETTKEKVKIDTYPIGVN